MNKKEIEDMFETLTKQWGDTDNYVNDLLSYSKNLQQENQELKKQYCERTDCSGRLGNSKKVEQLIKENQELKKKYENAVVDYETTMFEKEQSNSLVNSCQEKIRQLKKQLEENQNPLKGIFAQVNDDTLLRDCGNMNAEINELKNQQKEFIEYLENEKDRLAKEVSQTYEDSLYKTRLVNEDIFNEVDTILSKYKEIIGDKE